MREEFLITRQGKQFVLFANQGPEIPKGYCRCGCGEKTAIAMRNDKRRGHRKGEPVSVIHGHNRRIRPPHLSVVDTGYETPCYLWNHGKTSEGYAQISLGGEKCLVHRLIHEAANGPLPSNTESHHLCEQRHCIRPEHLISLTHVDHARVSSYAKISLEAARAIYASKELGVVLAKRYGISRQAVCDIRKSRRWKGVAA